MRSGVLFLLLLTVSAGETARILAILPSPSVSHHVVYNRYLLELHRRGHDITVATPCPIDSSNLTNYRQIEFTQVMKYWRSIFTGSSDGSFLTRIIPEVFLHFLYRPVQDMCEMYLSHPELREIFERNEKFDLVVLEWGTMTCTYPFMKQSGNVTVGIASFQIGFWSHFMIGGTVNPAYISEIGLPYTDRMTFLQRFRNSILYANIVFYVNLYYKRADELVRKHLGGDIPSVTELEKEVGVVLAHFHASTHFPRPITPNVIPIGGPPFHLYGYRPKPLPQDIQQFLDEAQDGVVYFSLGSNVRSEAMPESKRQIFLEAFRRIKEKVLWKWEADVLPGKPDNVKIGKWLPQTDILAHPNVRLFVTQGGLQSVSEATYNKIPMVVIPFFADQELNANKLVSEGVAIRVDYESLQLETFLSALNQVLNDKKYKESIIKYSALTQDQPENPLDRAIWWTEYVIRHKGAKHLRSAAVDMPWYQYFLLDVFAFLTAIFISLLYLLYVVIKLITRILCKGNKAKKD